MVFIQTTLAILDDLGDSLFAIMIDESRDTTRKSKISEGN